VTKLSAQDITLKYPLFSAVRGQPTHQLALDSVSFDLAEGDKLGVVGANGAGKTSLLRVLSGVVIPDAGKVQSVGVVQSLMETGLGINGDATGYENIQLRLLAAGYTWKQARELSEPIAAYSELDEYLERPVDTYSRGMQLRLSFSIATTLDADILIMDEWIGAGDAAFREKAAQRMEELVAAAGIVVLASHNNRLLERICNKGIFLEKGKVRYFGDMGEAIRCYADA